MNQSNTSFFNPSAWWSWIRSKFTFDFNRTKEITVQVINRVEPLIPIAVDVVQSIEHTIKAELKEAALNTSQIQVLVQRQLITWGFAVDVATRLSSQLSVLPVADLLLNLGAVFLQKDQQNISQISVSLARTVIQLAYEIYQTSREVK